MGIRPSPLPGRARITPAELEIMGHRGRHYVWQFDLEKVLGEFEKILAQLGQEGSSRIF